MVLLGKRKGSELNHDESDYQIKCLFNKVGLRRKKHAQRHRRSVTGPRKKIVDGFSENLLCQLARKNQESLTSTEFSSPKFYFILFYLDCDAQRLVFWAVFVA